MLQIKNLNIYRQKVKDLL